MKIIKSEIRRLKREPRKFKELATLKLEEGDKLRRSHDNMPITVGKSIGMYPRRVKAKRFVLKDGTPRSPWLFIINHYAYTEDSI